MSCPYFYPEAKCERLLWNHSTRLPLGAGWQGCCQAPAHAGERPDDDDLRLRCNLGYAAGCSRMPAEIEVDAVRFGVFRSQSDAAQAESRINVHFIRERRHLPVDHGTLVFDAVSGVWAVTHPNEVLQRQAQCFMESWLERNGKR